MIKHTTIQRHPVILDGNVLTVEHPYDGFDVRTKSWTLSAKDLNPNANCISLKAAYDIASDIQQAWGTLYSTELADILTDAASAPSKVRFIKELRELTRDIRIPKPFTITFDSEDDYVFAQHLLVNAGVEGWK